MKALDEKSISELPIHDSDLLGVQISQNDNGDTDLILRIGFYKEEINDLCEEYLKFINPDGVSSLLFKNCRLINMNAICNTTQRDEVDYIQFLQDSPELKYGLKHVIVIFISGSKLECIVENIFLTS